MMTRLVGHIYAVTWRWTACRSLSAIRQRLAMSRIENHLAVVDVLGDVGIDGESCPVKLSGNVHRLLTSLSPKKRTLRSAVRLKCKSFSTCVAVLVTVFPLTDSLDWLNLDWIVFSAKNL